MSNTIERSPRTVVIGDNIIQAEKLAKRLPFARKPADLSQVHGREYVEVYVTETKELTTAAFDDGPKNVPDSGLPAATAQLVRRKDRAPSMIACNPGHFRGPVMPGHGVPLPNIPILGRVLAGYRELNRLDGNAAAGTLENGCRELLTALDLTQLFPGAG
ncbi:hypothetical protein ACEQUB_p01127 (plasmid) [Ralstonia syzygii]